MIAPPGTQTISSPAENRSSNSTGNYRVGILTAKDTFQAIGIPADKPEGDAVMDALGGVQLLDPTTGTMKPFHLPGCIFSDETSAGTIACFPTDTGYLVPNRHTLRITGPSGKADDFVLSVPRFNYVGDAYFSPDETMLTVGGATGNAAPPALGATSAKPEQYGTDLVTVDTAVIRRFGPTGTRPAMVLESWLPDVQLVLWRPDSVGGVPGLYVLNPRGTGTGSEIVVSGAPIGYLSS